MSLFARLPFGAAGSMADGNHSGGLRIIHVVSSLGVGGMERMLLQLASAQQSAGHQVAILALRGGPLQHEAATRSLRTHVLGGGRFARVVSASRVFLAAQPDIVHVHNPTSLHYAVLSKMTPRASIIVTLHGDQDTHARLGSNFEWRLTSSAVVVSNAALTTLRLSRCAGPLTVIHNGIESTSIAASGTKARLENHDVLVGVMVARIDGRKGHGTLIRGLHDLKNSGINIRVLVIGDGAERGKVEQHARALALNEKHIQFLGRRSDIDDLLSAADFFVLPSDIEGLPMAILEAMAHGLPIVASNVGGIPEIIDDEREGLLFPAGDATALALAIRRLASDPFLRRRLGDAARQRVSAQFSLNAMVRKYDDVYADAMRGRRVTA